MHTVLIPRKLWSASRRLWFQGLSFWVPPIWLISDTTEIVNLYICVDFAQNVLFCCEKYPCGNEIMKMPDWKKWSGNNRKINLTWLAGNHVISQRHAQCNGSPECIASPDKDVERAGCGAFTKMESEREQSKLFALDKLWFLVLFITFLHKCFTLSSFCVV